MNTLILNKKEYPVPGTWNELTTDQIFDYVRILNSSLTKYQSFIALVLMLLNAKKKPVLVRAMLSGLSRADIMSFKPLTEFLKDLTLTKNPLPYIRIGLTKYIGVSDELKNIAFWEFVKADLHFQNYHKTNKIEHLNKLVAVLYRKRDKTMTPESPDYKGDLRQPYNDHNVAEREALFSKIPFEKKFAVYLFYAGCRRKIVETYPNIFPAGTPKKGGRKRIWANVVKELAQGKITEFEDINRELLSTVFFSWNEDIQDAIEKKNKK
jgi:hypothetical protein